MKMVLAILRHSDTDPVSQRLISAGFRVTRIASTGGFLRRGSTTLLIGVADEGVETVITTIRSTPLAPVGPGEKRATLFVLPVEGFTQI